MRQVYTARIRFIVLLLLVLLPGCGTTSQPTTTTTKDLTISLKSSPTSISTPVSISTSTSDPSSRLTPNKHDISIDLSGLHIDASDGVQCPLGAQTKGPPDNPGPILGKQHGNNLVLATDRLIYDSSELEQIRNYLGGNPNVAPPDTLRWMLGGSTDASQAVYVDGKAVGYVYNCGVILNITNITQNPLQIANVGMQLAGDTQQNNYHYRLIDQCSVVSCRMGGGPGSCSQYFATVKLGTGSINTVFSATPVGRDASCGELTLNPGEAKTLFVYIYSSQSFIYSVVPQLVLSTSNGPNTLTLTGLTSTLAFASGSQFTCYMLQGDRFVAETTPAPNSVCV